mmetsp:Transcript_11106/g.21761  ORF Transcript_11106/g.21761 Transcript_11106/m.21761 type:complete len:154 (+) Transcript_11106:2336-2797(+)
MSFSLLLVLSIEKSGVPCGLSFVEAIGEPWFLINDKGTSLKAFNGCNLKLLGIDDGTSAFKGKHILGLICIADLVLPGQASLSLALEASRPLKGSNQVFSLKEALEQLILINYNLHLPHWLSLLPLPPLLQVPAVCSRRPFPLATLHLCLLHY